MRAVRIDAHQHVWSLARGDYGWLTPEAGPLWRDFGMADSAPLRAAAGIDGVVLVQAAPTVAETEFLLRVAESDPAVLAVVGWVDFEDRQAPDTLARLAEHPRLRGVRPMIQDLEDDDWMLRADLGPAFDAVEELGLVFDALVLPRHLTRLDRLLERHPGLSVVVDHGAKPPLREFPRDGSRLACWREDLARIAARPTVSCKLSGLVTEAPRDWTVADLRPASDALLELFGPSRLVWGSDWPVSLLARGYAAWWQATSELLAPLDPDGRRAVLGANAARVYSLEGPA